MSVTQVLEKLPALRNSIGADLQALAKDRAIVTDPEETRRRRTIRLSRLNSRTSWGFTLQTYGIRNKRSREVEVMSYVDYVEIRGPAWVAGMKKGDVILSVNGDSVEGCTHRELVTKIQQAGRDLRLVVLFEDCCRKVELQERYIKLKKMLSLKIKELHRLESEESRLLKGAASLSLAEGDLFGSTPSLLSRLSTLRQSGMSFRSIQSSTSSDWDAYSELASTQSLNNVPANKFAFDGSLSDGSSVSQASTHDSGGSAIEASLSSSGSLSETQPVDDVDMTVVIKDKKVDKATGQGKRLPIMYVKQTESESEMSDNFLSGDGDTDSQASITSFTGPAAHEMSITDVMTQDPTSPSTQVEKTFRQMYTVARWVGMVRSGNPYSPNLGKGRRFSTGNIGLSDLSKVGRARSLSSVTELGEDTYLGDGISTGSIPRESAVDVTPQDLSYSSGRNIVDTETDSDSNSIVSDENDSPNHDRRGTITHIESDSDNVQRIRRGTVIRVRSLSDGGDQKDHTNCKTDVNEEKDRPKSSENILGQAISRNGVNDANVTRPDKIKSSGLCASHSVKNGASEHKGISNTINREIPKSGAKFISKDLNTGSSSYSDDNSTTQRSKSSLSLDSTNSKFVKGVLVNETSYDTKL